MDSGHMKSVPAFFTSDVRPGTNKDSDDSVYGQKWTFSSVYIAMWQTKKNGAATKISKKTCLADQLKKRIADRGTNCAAVSALF